MDFLGVGPTEFLFIIIIALIVFGPKDLAKTGSTVGKWLNGIIQSDGWKAIRKTSEELRRLPTQLMRDDNFKNFLTPDDLMQKAADKKRDAWTGQTAKPELEADPKNEITIQPPVAVEASPAQTAKPARKKSAVSSPKKASPTKKTARKPATKSSARTARKKNA